MKTILRSDAESLCFADEGDSSLIFASRKYFHKAWEMNVFSTEFYLGLSWTFDQTFADLFNRDMFES